MLRRLRQSHGSTAAFRKYPFVCDLVVFGFATERPRCDFLQFLLSIHCRGVRGTSHCMRGLAAAGNTCPRQVLSCVSPGEIAFLPRHAQHLCNDAMAINDGFGAEVSDSRLNRNPPVGFDQKQPVIASGSAKEATD